MTNKRGFTLIELLVVVLIIGILAAVALPQYEKAVAKARIMQAIVTVKAITDAQERYFAEHSEYTNNLEDLDIEIKNPTEYYIFECGGKRSCWGYARKENYPKIEFVMKVPSGELADRPDFWGRHLCVASHEYMRPYCAMLGKQEQTGSIYYKLQ